jgi:hypothetical protein
MLELSIVSISSFVTFLDTVTIVIGRQCFKKDINRFIPIFSLIYGLGLGIAGYYTPNIDMGSNLIEAIFIGLSAGAAATGINQVGKQLSKDDTTSSVLLKVQNYLASLVDIADEEVEEDSEEENEIEEDCVEEKETSSEDEPSETDVPESDDVIDDDNAVEDDSQSDEESPADEEDE